MSPLNESPQSLAALCKKMPTQEAIFDPQLFVPQSLKGHFGEWTYFGDFAKQHTRGSISAQQWVSIASAIISECEPLGHRAVCSPAVVSKEHADERLAYDVQVGNVMHDVLEGTLLDGLQTAILSVSNLEGNGRPETVASILTTGKLARVYVVPRWTKSDGELQDSGEIAGFFQMLRYLSGERKILVGFCGPEMILWKAAGAHAVASGKYANQQRFDLARYSEVSGGGGGNVAYYFEESLLAWLRYEDIVALQRLDYPVGVPGDPFWPLIFDRIEALKKNPPRREPELRNGKPIRLKNGKTKMRRVGPPDWVGLGWSQWLWWFGRTEGWLSSGKIDARELIENAQRNWAMLKVKHFLPSDRANDGRWLAPWLAALKS